MRVGPPPLAKFAKEDHEWNRYGVEGTIRQWFNYMVLDTQDEAKRVRDEWRQKFDEIPVDGDINSLREDLKPQWKLLPTRSQQLDPRHALFAREFGGSSAVENPIINPVTGCGRTSAEVQREVDAYRMYLRKNHQVRRETNKAIQCLRRQMMFSPCS